MACRGCYQRNLGHVSVAHTALHRLVVRRLLHNRAEPVVSSSTYVQYLWVVTARVVMQMSANMSTCPLGIKVSCNHEIPRCDQFPSMTLESGYWHPARRDAAQRWTTGQLYNTLVPKNSLWI
jgi:hypothetical protein